MLDSVRAIPSENPIDFTIAICTYNGAERLPLVLERLKGQINTENIAWEIIVVDNNSSDRTAQVVREYQADWLERFPLVYQFEPQQGLAYARQRALSAARGELLGFLDDDNLPAPDWVARAYEFARSHPNAGAFGGQVHAAIEGEMPAYFPKIAVFLAIVERGSQAFIYQPQKRILPPAAGIVIRKQAWLATVPERSLLKGRIGSSMLASEDLEFLSYLQLGGWEIWYNPQMHIDHQIPPHRLERAYLLSLVRGIGLARHPIRMIRTNFWLQPLLFPVYTLNDLRRAILFFVNNRKAIKTDVASACEMEFLLSSLYSPFYWATKYKKSQS
ncbi:hormogonium polysaccharide biosynthesis glycosyltransferase HpsE [Oscillatoria sp. FACHB-1406]|uniref:hormogonium polysaccharide biosynthesis glycosyltransferase HpsE n=1 Tax=Oscillatoria sp. FACHB-1406 TaxID=2692846 RepID=UPI001682EB93|nr:hormogonium polysaccharide biosynthesis glycosyltransferase HpsE [Oscillatoria sp. FACHB-1406]MBD2579631.1 glycosyltransferase family 2 protein [Oscillatoria sp. FACHB-1406]